MGHERLGILPKTKPWVRIVEELTSSDLDEDKVKVVASQTLENVEIVWSRSMRTPGL